MKVREFSQVEHDLQLQLETALSLPLQIGISEQTLSFENLTSKEFSTFILLKRKERQSSWLKARRALKQVLQALGENEDTTLITFPHCRFSLSHSGSYGIAIGTSSTKITGIGIDFERERTIQPRSTRFFLSPSEQSCYLSEAPNTLLRLWTTKEALYKSDPMNRERTLKDYILENPQNHVGTAHINNTEGYQFRYASFPLDTGFLTVAICQ